MQKTSRRSMSGQHHGDLCTSGLHGHVGWSGPGHGSDGRHDGQRPFLSHCTGWEEGPRFFTFFSSFFSHQFFVKLDPSGGHWPGVCDLQPGKNPRVGRACKKAQGSGAVFSSQKTSK